MRTQLRIVAGSLRGRKLTCSVGPGLRPAPQRVREALFSILGNAVPDRPFFDLFAGSGAVGMEAVSRGSGLVTLVERDFRVAGVIEQHLHQFGITAQAKLVRGDVYRWVEHWPGIAEPVNIFLGPPFVDLVKRPDALHAMIEGLRQKVALGSVVVVQAEHSPFLDQLPDPAQWDRRQYGRNLLLIWVKE